MFFVELFGPKGHRFSKVQNIGLVDVYVPKVVEIDRVVFPTALSTDIITDVYCVKKNTFETRVLKSLYFDKILKWISLRSLHFIVSTLN